jgi:hypothetical protein
MLNLNKNCMLMACLFAVGFVLNPTRSYGFFEGSQYFTSIAYMNENLTRTTDNYEGKTSFLGTASDIPIFFGLALPSGEGAFGLEGGASWMPRIGYTFVPRKTKDNAAKVEYLILSLPYVKSFGTWGFDYMLGTSYIRQTYKGTGGTVASDNGGSPATYYQGDYDQTAAYLTLDFGLGYNLPPYKISTEVFVLSAFSDKRSYNLLINFTYFWGSTL